MATKKYMSLERMVEYDALIKTKIDSGDESTLSSAKSYTDAEVAKDRERLDSISEDLETHTHSYNDLSDKPFEMEYNNNSIVLYDDTFTAFSADRHEFYVGEANLSSCDGKNIVVTFNGQPYDGTYTYSDGIAKVSFAEYELSQSYEGFMTLSPTEEWMDYELKLEIIDEYYTIPESVIPESITRKGELNTKADKVHSHDYSEITGKPFEMELVSSESTVIFDDTVTGMSNNASILLENHLTMYNGKTVDIVLDEYYYRANVVDDYDIGGTYIKFGEYKIFQPFAEGECIISPIENNETHELSITVYDYKYALPENVIPETIARTTYVDTALEGKSDANHNHDDEYYTESEIDTKIDTINAEFENIRTNVVPSLEQEILDHANDNYLHVDSISKLKWDTHIETPHAPSDAEANQDAFGSIVVGIEGDDYKHIAYARSESDSFGIIGGDLITFLLGTDKHEDENVNYETLTISVDSDKLDARYDAKGAASTTLDEAKTYTDTKVSGLATSSSVTSSISSHNASTSAHNDIRTLISDLSTKVNNFLDVDDTTADELSEILAMIKANEGTLESLTSSKVNVSDIVDNLTTSSTTKVLSAKQGVALKALIDALQTAVDGKAAEGHGHAIADVTNLQSTLDAKAAQTALEGHIDDATKHITSVERANWNTAKTHADSAHAPSDAQENVIESIKVNGTAQTITSKTVNITVPTKASDIDAAATSHGTHVEYSTIAPVMDGTASAGSASTVARSDHKHPTDTSRASQVALDELAEVVDGKADSVHVHDVATASANGFMSSTMFTKLNGIEDGATKVIVDTALNTTSSNAIANSVVTSNINTLSQAIQTNAGGITTNANSIKALEESIVEITSEEIQALFAS